jgi:hypothetical protein
MVGSDFELRLVQASRIDFCENFDDCHNCFFALL